ncbi:MAG TPA: hypothetical protein PKI17_00260 [Syntrophomonas sp.]|nr:hypothetical protein [Syntrophomonas sp.]
MKDSHVFILIVALALLCYGGAFLAGYFYGKEEAAASINSAEARIDTVRIKVPVNSEPEKKLKKIPARMKLDTLKVYGCLPNPEGSNGYAAVRVVFMDTTITGYGRAAVDYFFPPINKFDFQWKPDPRPETTILKTVYVPQVVYKQQWYQKEWLWFTAGAATALVIAGQLGR